MDAGPQLDHEMATKVMGWIYLGPRWSDENMSGYAWRKPTNEVVAAEHFQPSTDLNAAWLIAEKFRAEGWIVRIEAPSNVGGLLGLKTGEGWVPVASCWLLWPLKRRPEKLRVWDGLDRPPRRNVLVSANTPALAVCLAALKAVRAAVPA